VPKVKGKAGSKGHYWKIDPDAKNQFTDSTIRRRPRGYRSIKRNMMNSTSLNSTPSLNSIKTNILSDHRLCQFKNENDFNQKAHSFTNGKHHSLVMDTNQQHLNLKNDYITSNQNSYSTQSSDEHHNDQEVFYNLYNLQPYLNSNCCSSNAHNTNQQSTMRLDNEFNQHLNQMNQQDNQLTNDHLNGLNGLNEAIAIQSGINQRTNEFNSLATDQSNQISSTFDTMQCIPISSSLQDLSSSQQQTYYPTSSTVNTRAKFELNNILMPHTYQQQQNQLNSIYSPSNVSNIAILSIHIYISNR
jgi:hypothetical protein